ncbi:MAG: DNA polymerase/3'-5' exonuclease PolX [Candidatus Eiseniibacteriota bacterium]
MATTNADIAAALDEIADLLELEDANAFRIRAYRNAARLLRDLRAEVTTMLAEGKKLSDLPGIGEDLAGKIAEIAERGTTPMLEKLRGEVPHDLAELMKLPGLGPKRVRALNHELDIVNIDQLHRAAKDGRIRTLAGFGAKTEQRILDALAARKPGPERMRLADAAGQAKALVAYLGKTPGAKRVIVAGSYRRAKETVGDLDILVTAKRGEAVMDRFVKYDAVREVLAKGPTRATVILRSGLQVDVRVVDEASYGSALHYFTGSKAHNIAVRTMGVKRGLKINEYGVFRGKRRIAGETEESVYKSVGLPYIEPELRENRGELEAAAKKQLPKLVVRGDLKGDLHVHTDATDGRATLGAMVEAARAHGLAYIAITEHSKRLTMAHGLDAKRLLRQGEAIDKLNAKKPGIAILKGIEVDILEDGSLDLPDDVLGELDLVVGAIHSKFNLTRARQTERILRAMDRPHFSILAHPSGRLIPEREPYDVDMARIIRAAKARGCFLELNAHPERLDLIDVHCRQAKDEGVLVAINSDAHSTLEFDLLDDGIGQARRGWLEKDDVLNTRPLGVMRKLLKRTM